MSSSKLDKSIARIFTTFTFCLVVLALVMIYILINISPNNCETKGKIYYKQSCYYEIDLLTKIQDECTQRVKEINRSMANTWGNDSYDTDKPTELGYDHIKNCTQDILSNIK